MFKINIGSGRQMMACEKCVDKIEKILSTTGDVVNNKTVCMECRVSAHRAYKIDPTQFLSKKEIKRELRRKHFVQDFETCGNCGNAYKLYAMRLHKRYCS